MFIRKRGQAFHEYIILLGLVAAAFIAMQTYMKRGVQGRLKNLADQINPKAYEPGVTTGTTNITRNGLSTEKSNLGTYTINGFDATRADYDSKTVEE
jgi:Flp pilus assembly pilin Flp